MCQKNSPRRHRKASGAKVLVTNIAENLCSFDVGENVQHPEQFAVYAAGRENYSRDEGTAMVNCEVTVAVFGDLFYEPEG